MTLHPNALTLSRFSDGDLPAWRAKLVAAHLRGCADCRAVVASVRAFADSARAAPSPAMRAGVWERIAERRGGGEKVIMPAETAQTIPRRPRWTAVAAAVIVAAAVVLIAQPFVRRAAAADPSALSFAPLYPKPGTDVSVRYRAVAELAEQQTLRVRARFYTSSISTDVTDIFSPLGVVVASLARSADGTFSGTLHFPDSAVYALLIVENDDGSQVDNDHRSLFDLVAAAPSGRPSFAGLRARAVRGQATCCMPPGTRARALVAADSLVVIYPDSAQSWHILVSVEGSSRIPHWLRVFDARERRFASLEKALGTRATVSSAEMQAMASLAGMIEDSVAAARWRSRLVDTYPLDPRTLYIIADRAQNHGQAAARSELPRFDTAWAHRSGTGTQIAEDGLLIAIEAKDSAAIARWVSRLADLPAPPYFVPVPEAWLADSVIRKAVQRQMMAITREMLAEPRTSRDLYYTRQQESLRRRWIAAYALITQGTALLSASQPHAALDSMNVAVGLVAGAPLPICGSGPVYRGRAKVQLALADSSAANRDLALAARSDSAPGKTCIKWAEASVTNRTDRTIASPARCACSLFAVMVTRITLSAWSSICAKTSR